jgi:hypothetical protein
VTGPLDDALAAYAARFPDEPAPAPDPGTAVHCVAVVCDAEGRVLQVNDPERGVWLFPSEPLGPGDGSLLAAARRALESCLGPLGATADADPIDVAAGPDGLVVSYRFTGADLTRLAPEVAQRARLAPCDTILNEQLGLRLVRS